MTYIDNGADQPPTTAADPSNLGLVDYQQFLAIIALQAQVLQVQDQINNLNVVVEQNTAAIAELAARTSTAIKDLPCPNGVYVGLPEDGWTGKPEDAPGATLANIGECVAEGYCNCDAGLALSPTWTPADEP